MHSAAMNRFLNALAHTRVYPLTDRQTSGRSHAEQVIELSDSGARVIQLREKDLSGREFFEEAAAAVAVARKRGVKIIINDRVDIALALKADGVHLGQDDLPVEAARCILGPTAIIGFSTHKLEQAKIAAQLPVDYVALGPIYPTRTKNSGDPVLGLTGVREIRTVLKAPLVAIGGISEANGRELLDAGADALAVIGDLWKLGPDAKHLRRRFIGLK
jgi:thiamine-phosphate pyrophosphorylase